jgi:hypothetical protein
VEVYFDAVVSQAERSEVERWVAANDSGEVEFIAIDDLWVGVYGRKSQFVGVTGTAPRHGSLADDLDAALGVMCAKRDA